ncbi:MAG: hypothetical protein CM15mP115_16790 [Alphaproteobacteria bacterium]|nr:MAG: hypothetical protein CM15mP115_16790 [Alphaproteobacteria bacterium]
MESRAESHFTDAAAGIDLVCLAGADERPEFIRQSHSAACLAGPRANCHSQLLAGHNHFTIIETMTGRQPLCELVDVHLAEIFKAARRCSKGQQPACRWRGRMVIRPTTRRRPAFRISTVTSPPSRRGAQEPACDIDCGDRRVADAAVTAGDHRGVGGGDDGLAADHPGIPCQRSPNGRWNVTALDRSRRPAAQLANPGRRHLVEKRLCASTQRASGHFRNCRSSH